MPDDATHLREEVAGLRTAVEGLSQAVAAVPETVKATIKEMFPAAGGGGPPAPEHEHVPVEG
jgi:hypothetical protein